MARFLLLAASLVCLSVCCANAESLASYRAKILSAFNAKRKDMGLSQVSYSSALNKRAQKWAESFNKIGRPQIQDRVIRLPWGLSVGHLGKTLPNANTMMSTLMKRNSTRPMMAKAALTKMGFGLYDKDDVYEMVWMFDQYIPPSIFPTIEPMRI